MNIELKTQYNDIKSIIRDLEMKRDVLGNEKVDALILKLNDKLKKIEIENEQI